MPGPQPTPKAILAARGSWRAKENGGGLQLDPGIPRCPKWLKGPARALWKRACKAFDAAGTLAKMDREQLALLCKTYGKVMHGNRLIEELGDEAFTTEAGRKVMRIVGAEEARLMHYAAKFGMTPADRARLRNGPEMEDDDPAERFFRTVG